jgi:hypothetical protein
LRSSVFCKTALSIFLNLTSTLPFHAKQFSTTSDLLYRPFISFPPVFLLTGSTALIPPAVFFF